MNDDDDDVFTAEKKGQCIKCLKAVQMARKKGEF